MPNLTADQHNLGLRQKGFLPSSIACKGDVDTILKGAVLTRSISEPKAVARQAASSTNPPFFVGISRVGTTLGNVNLEVFSNFWLYNKVVSGNPSVGKYVYLKTYADKISDNLYVTNGEVRALTVGTSITFTNDSTDVTGVGTSFTTELNVGDDIYGLTDGVAYKQTIASIASDTSLVLEEAYAGTTDANTGAYGVYESGITTNPFELYGTTEYYNVQCGMITDGSLADGWTIHIFSKGVKSVKESISMSLGQAVALTFPWNDFTNTEQAATYAKVYDESADAYLDLSGSSAGAYNVDYQLFPDTEAEDDAVYFGGATPFGSIYTDCGTGTAAIYGDDSITWEYWNGTAWTTLTIIYDETDTTNYDGSRSFIGDGYTFFSAPTDWVSLEIDSQTAYWVRARIYDAKITTIPISDSHEHFLTSIDTGMQVPYSGIIGRGHFNFNTPSTGTADTKVILLNNTSGACSAVSTITKAKKDPEVANFNLSVATGDTIAFFVIQVDGGGAEYEYGACELEIVRV